MRRLVPSPDAEPSPLLLLLLLTSRIGDRAEIVVVYNLEGKVHRLGCLDRRNRCRLEQLNALFRRFLGPSRPAKPFVALRCTRGRVAGRSNEPETLCIASEDACALCLRSGYRVDVTSCDDLDVLASGLLARVDTLPPGHARYFGISERLLSRIANEDGGTVPIIIRPAKLDLVRERDERLGALALSRAW